MCTVRPSGATLSGVRSSTSPLKIRLDVVGERAFRYWITAEPDIVHRVTPLLAGPVPTTPDAVSEEFDGGVTLRAAGASLHVEIPPIGGPMVRVLDRSGVEVGAVGGGEADLYGTWDSFPTWRCRTPAEGHPFATEVLSLGAGEAVHGSGYVLDSCEWSPRDHGPAHSVAD